MSLTLSKDQRAEFAARGFSRRSFGRIATLMGAGAASLPFFGEHALAQLSQVKGMPADAVKINANENPLGPCQEAVDAIHSIVKMGGRYSYELTDEFREILAAQEGLTPDNVAPFPGSSAPLHQSVLAFTSPARSFVIADPGYEAGERAAKFIGANVIRVKLTKDYAHDVRAMAAADPNAGVLYICNPNNPTGTLTSKEDIEWLADNKPRGSILLIDEAYTHIAGAPFMSHLVAQNKDVILLRTFSKIYGMAGIRAGAALGRADLLEKMTGFSAGALPITGMVAANASLKSKDVVPVRRKIIGDVRRDVLAFLDKHGFEYVPSVSNKFMVNVKRPGDDVIMAMRKENVYIGRVWASMPTYVRVSVGTQEEMDKFKAAFLKVMA
jgi:histidinol-phosphate/aromatic aminotransferase/cobyric acid decarboxylase-like protein